LGHPPWDIIVHDAVQDKKPPADIAVSLAVAKYAGPCYFTNIHVIYPLPLRVSHATIIPDTYGFVNMHWITIQLIW
jgi:hypothetical protein